MELEARLEFCPNAVFIQTHREPTKFNASRNSVVEPVRDMTKQSLRVHKPRSVRSTEQRNTGNIVSSLINVGRRRIKRLDLFPHDCGTRDYILLESLQAEEKASQSHRNPLAKQRRLHIVVLIQYPRREVIRTGYRISWRGATPESAQESVR